MHSWRLNFYKVFSQTKMKMKWKRRGFTKSSGYVSTSPLHRIRVQKGVAKIRWARINEFVKYKVRVWIYTDIFRYLTRSPSFCNNDLIQKKRMEIRSAIYSLLNVWKAVIPKTLFSLGFNNNWRELPRKIYMCFSILY